MPIDLMLSLAMNVHASKGVYALLVGSGVSPAARIPTGWEVVGDMAAKLAAMQGTAPLSDPQRWFREKYKVEPDYSALLKELAPARGQRQQVLRAYFEPTDEERNDGVKLPTAAHHAIAKLVASGHIRIIVTTNFDRLLEQAIEQVGIVPTVLSTIDSFSGALPLVHQKCVILKLHGDYLDSRTRNSLAELEAYPPKLRLLLDRIIDEFGLIIAGWSGEWDHALRGAVEACKSRRFPTYWSTICEPSDLARRLITLRGGDIIQTKDADTFFDELANKVSVLSELGQNQPISAAIAVGLVKRYVAVPSERIRLHDLMIDETDSAARDSHQLLRSRSDTTTKGLRTVFLQISTRLSRLRQMLGQAAYWGGDDTIGLVTKCISRIAHDPPPQDGVVIHTFARAYLAGMALHAAGTAYLLAGNYVSAFRLAMLAEIQDSGDDNHFITALTSSLDSIRATLNAGTGANTYVPFSELMFNELQAEFTSLAPSPIAFETRHDEWELLVAFAYAEVQKIKPEGDGRGWITPGRFAWKLARGSHRSTMFPPPRGEVESMDNLKRHPAFAQLIDAGFFGGRWERVPELRQLLRETAVSIRLTP